MSQVARSILNPPVPFPLPVKIAVFPKLAPVRLEFPRPRVADLRAAVSAQLDALQWTPLRDQRVAVTAGSRGIRDIVPVLAATVAWLRQRGADPIVVAAMGSHGGATSEGQRSLLTHLGLTPQTVGASIVTDMDTVELGRTPEGLRAYCDRTAASCDAILIVNRVKRTPPLRNPLAVGC